MPEPYRTPGPRGVLPAVLPVAIYIPTDTTTMGYETVEMEVNFDILVSTLRGEVRRQLDHIHQTHREMQRLGGDQTYNVLDEKLNHHAWLLHQALAGLEKIQDLEEEVAEHRAERMRP